MDEIRVRNIARALCRAARLDPDLPSAATAEPRDGMRVAGGARDVADGEPAWKLFLGEAERFCLSHVAGAGGIEGRPR